MFQIIWSCISQLWELLRESMSSANNSQTPSSSPSDSMPCTTNSQITSSSPSESVAFTTDSQTQYDVFLSFRGKDTRLNFTGHLYDKLDSNGIRTFMDDPELRSGEVISDALLDAIRKSKTYIIVLSENYASSSWCLGELVEIFSCHKTAQRSVIPVFYKIDPSVVRHQIGSFKQAFKKHHVRVEMEKVNNWRFTLAQVADFSGFHICENTSEADVINEIVDNLRLKINPKTLDVAKYPVGLESRVKAITTLLSSETKGVIKFGIYGMGGVGKTTLAKALYNQLLHEGSYKGSCFLANVREASNTFKGLESLQKKLINDVLKCKKTVEVDSVAEGKKLISHRICSAKVLVLIDDIYDLQQYESLAGPFASGSVVIITTRDEEVLDKIKVEPRYRYMVNVLNAEESLSLFTKHAFGNDEQDNKLMVLSKHILRLANGLPLALEVFGAYLCTQRSEEGWKCYINKLQRDPDSTIQQKLIISLDAVGLEDRLLKQIFLDIACFFIGDSKEEVVEIMETCCQFADHKIDILKKRCLLTINRSRFGRNELGMHDLLRDVGREIARNNSVNEPGNYTRLWAVKDICDVLENHSGTRAIECIIYKDGGSGLNGVTFTTETFKRMSRLRFLKLIKVNLTGSFAHIFKDLRWLRWEFCPLECLPSEFYPQQLVRLELPRSNMRTMWELNMGSHVFRKLKTLNMSHSRYLATTDFTRVPYLKTLDLYGCGSLEEVHTSIGSLASLVSLNLRDCKKLRSLPDSICDLRALKVLSISGCKSMEALPIQLGNIDSLTELSAEGLTVSKLPDSIGHLTKLVKLDLRYNKKLAILLDTICNVGSLKILEIDGCERLETLPDQLWKITSLRVLDASFATMLKKLPDIGSSQTALSLQELKLSYSGITALPSGFSQLSNVKNLYLHHCGHLHSIPELPPNLKRIVATSCISLERIPNLSNLKHLEDLRLGGCTGLTEIKGLEELNSIRWLDLGGLSVSLVAYNLTKPLFQMYSEFGHPIRIYGCPILGRPIRMYGCPILGWITESPYWTSESSELTTGLTTVYAHLLPNQSHNFMGIILCLGNYGDINYSVKNTTSGFIWSGSPGPFISGSVMEIVPKSIFSITDDDRTIEITADYTVKILGIHLLYNTGT